METYYYETKNGIRGYRITAKTDQEAIDAIFKVRADIEIIYKEPEKDKLVVIWDCLVDSLKV